MSGRGAGRGWRLVATGLCVIAVATVAGVAQVAARVTIAPSCVAPTLDASARLPHTPLLVTPAPNGRDAMPQTQLSFLGAPASRIANLVVRGSATGVHAGRLASYSNHDGGSFLPSKPFKAGELVRVRGDWRSRRATQPFAYSFTVGYPDRIARLPVMAKPAGGPGTVWHFRSAPALRPAVLTVTKSTRAARRDGDIFLAGYPGPGVSGPTIYSPDGQLVWFRPLPAGTFATNLQVQHYEGKPVLTWWQGTISTHGFGFGEGRIYSRSYQPIAIVRAGDGLAEDLHDLVITRAGSALITAWKPLLCDLAGEGGKAVSAVYDAVFQQIDIKTGLVMYEWDSLEHVPLSDSYLPASGASVAWPYDWFHLNSVAVEPNGSLLISARSTWAVYDLDASTGQMIWTAGGRQPTLAMAAGTTTAWQHDAEPLGDGTYSVFDNGGPLSGTSVSQGLVVRVDAATHSTALVATLSSPSPVYAETQGDVQRLADGNWWIGWGVVNESSELSPTGALLYAAHTPPGAQSYRSYRFPWSGRPTGRPALAVGPARGVSRPVYVSWNGATLVARWRLEAGTSPGRLRTLPAAARTGFETVLGAPSSARYLAVAALDTRGRVLAVSDVVATTGLSGS